MPFNHALLKAWRQQNHLTRKEVAAHLCVSHTYYVKLENGERRLNFRCAYGFFGLYMMNPDGL